jgi:hypothetical protein
MSSTVLPSIHALCSSDDSLLAREVDASMIRTQTAVVRSLLDEVERLTPSVISRRALRAQLTDEIMRLACGLVDTARRSDPLSTSIRSESSVGSDSESIARVVWVQGSRGQVSASSQRESPERLASNPLEALLEPTRSLEE